MNTCKFSFLILTAVSVLVSCGPVKTKDYTSPYTVAEHAYTDQTKRILSLNTFVFNEETKDCRNAQGVIGYNTLKLGPCSLITSSEILEKQLPKMKVKDLRGSMFFKFTLKAGTDFKGVNLQDTQWVSVKGKKINFRKAKTERAQFTSCQFLQQ